MNEPLPEPSPTTTDGQRHLQPTYDSLEEVTRQIAAEVARDLPPTSYRDSSETAPIGTAPAVQQPGRPAMSQKATDASTIILSIGFASPLVGAGIAVALWGTGHADSTVIVLIASGAVAVILAAKSFLKSVKDVAESAPRDVHNHYDGAYIQQDHSTHESKTTGLWAKTTNNPKGKK